MQLLCATLFVKRSLCCQKVAALLTGGSDDDDQDDDACAWRHFISEVCETFYCTDRYVD